MKISVIVPTHNRSDALEKTLEHLAVQQFSEEWEVIVVNNNCTDATDKVVEKAKNDFPVSLMLVYEKTPGAAAARNAGARMAKGDYLIFIDNDILTEPDFIRQHYEALKQNPNSWIVGQVANLPAQEKSIFGKYRKTLYPIFPLNEPIRLTEGITGQTVSLPRQDFLELDGFDENFYVASGEDNEFAMRARKQLGIKTLLLPSILVVHNDWAGSTFEDFRCRQHIYSETEFYFWQRYGDEHPRLKLVKENLPVDWKNDSPKSLFRKKAKQFLGNTLMQDILLKLCNSLEKVNAPSFILWRLYKLTLAGAINSGFQKGRLEYLKRR